MLAYPFHFGTWLSKAIKTSSLAFVISSLNLVNFIAHIIPQLSTWFSIFALISIAFLPLLFFKHEVSYLTSWQVIFEDFDLVEFFGAWIISSSETFCPKYTNWFCLLVYASFQVRRWLPTSPCTSNGKALNSVVSGEELISGMAPYCCWILVSLGQAISGLGFINLNEIFPTNNSP